jgi:hypothetical protein
LSEHRHIGPWDINDQPVATSFSGDIEQMITLRDVEALGDLADRIRNPGYN